MGAAALNTRAASAAPFALPPSMLLALWCTSSCLLALRMARRGLRKESLNATGAVAAVVVGTIHMACGLQYGITLICFYVSSSKMTALGSERKAQLEEGHRKQGGARGAKQVLANSTLACAYALAARLAAPGAAARMAGALGLGSEAALGSALLGAFLGHYACCCGDTWASEGGILSATEPRLITTARRVPRGTNGGVSPLGLALSAAGGAAMGLVAWAARTLACAAPPLMGAAALGTADWCATAAPAAGAAQPPGLLYAAAAWAHAALPGAGREGLVAMVGVGLACGLAGSLVDSLLGATLQYSGVDTCSGRVVPEPRPGATRVAGRALLSNDAVNALAAATTAVLGAWLMLLAAEGSPVGVLGALGNGSGQEL